MRKKLNVSIKTIGQTFWRKRRTLKTAVSHISDLTHTLRTVLGKYFKIHILGDKYYR